MTDCFVACQHSWCVHQRTEIAPWTKQCGGEKLGGKMKFGTKTFQEIMIHEKSLVRLWSDHMTVPGRFTHANQAQGKAARGIAWVG